MIRNEQLIEKLIADLHFHNYLDVAEGDFFGNNIKSKNNPLYDLLSSWGINPDTSFYRGGTVIGEKKHDYIYEYIDDVFIDYFFRSYSFKEIIFPKGFCYKRVTPTGIIYPQDDVVLNLNNIYDRCTFANNIWRLFGIDKALRNLFPENGFFEELTYYDKIFGQHAHCGVLDYDFIPFHLELEDYVSNCSNGHILDDCFRGKEILKYAKYIQKDWYHCTSIYNAFVCNILERYHRGYMQIRTSNIFGEYTIEEILCIYSLLTDKFCLKEDSFILGICRYLKFDNRNTILDDFIQFEEDVKDYHIIEPYIHSKDLYLRFTSRERSKAFTFTPINNVIESIKRFEEPPIRSIFKYNTMPLPYLYNHLNLL